MTEQTIGGPSASLPAHPVAPSSAAASTCDCGHDAARHDPTALRYCLATASNELRRHCICHVADALPMSRR